MTKRITEIEKLTKAIEKVESTKGYMEMPFKKQQALFKKAGMTMKKCKPI